MNIYIKPELEEQLRTEPSMSGLINHLLAVHYGALPRLSGRGPLGEAKPDLPPTKLEKRESPAKVLSAAIPGVEVASEARCKGTHYMNRTNCGKSGCPWSNVERL